MNPRIQRLCSCVSVLAWAGVLLYFAASGRINSYLAPIFRHYALAGGIGLTVMGLFILLTFRQASACGHDHAPGESHDHEASDLPAWVILGLMLVPALGAAFFTTDSFSPSALAHKAAVGGSTVPMIARPPGAVPTRDEILKSRPRGADGSVKLELLELFAAASDAEYAANLEGIYAEIEGRVSRGLGSIPEPFLYRLLLSCCAADGRPLPLRLRNLGEDKFTNNAWMKIHGVIRYERAPDGSLYPLVEVRAIEDAPAPEDEVLLRQ